MTENAFRAAWARDRESGLIPDPALADWRYIRRTRHDVDQPLAFEYHGPADLLHWIADRFDRLDTTDLGPATSRSFWAGRPIYMPAHHELLARSAAAHERLLAALDSSAPRGPELHHPQDVYNVQDFHYCTSLGSGIRVVLDYGAGYGRQAFLFATVLEGAHYIAVDAVEQSYMVQRWVFDTLELTRWDYVDDPSANRATVRDALGGAKGALHLPSWRLDLLPDRSVDLVLFVWSLYEMSGAAARAAIESCARLVRLGGYVYIRDVPHSVSYRFDPERRLARAGFELLYTSRAIAGDELHGRQRLYRRVAETGRSRAVGALRPKLRRIRATRGAIAEGRRQRRAER